MAVMRCVFTATINYFVFIYFFFEFFFHGGFNAQSSALKPPTHILLETFYFIFLFFGKKTDGGYNPP